MYLRRVTISASELATAISRGSWPSWFLRWWSAWCLSRRQTCKGMLEQETLSCVYLSSVPLLGRHMESRVPLSVNSVNPNRVEYQELTGHHTAWQDTLVDGCPSLLIGVPRTKVHVQRDHSDKMCYFHGQCPIVIVWTHQTSTQDQHLVPQPDTSQANCEPQPLWKMYIW